MSDKLFSYWFKVLADYNLANPKAFTETLNDIANGDTTPKAKKEPSTTRNSDSSN